MSRNKAKQLANHYWNKKEEEIEAAIKKAVAKGKIKKEEIKKVRERIEERIEEDAKSKEAATKRETEREKTRETERILWLQQEEEKKTKIIKTARKPKKVEEKNTPPKRKKLQSAIIVVKKIEVPERKKRKGKVLNLRLATEGTPIKIRTKNKNGRSVLIQEYLLFPENKGLEINVSSGYFTEKENCFLAKIGDVLIQNIPKESRHEDILRGVFSLKVVKTCEKEWEELYLNLTYRHELSGSKPVYIARIDSEKEDPMVGSMHTTPTTNAKMILHLYPV